MKTITSKTLSTMVREAPFEMWVLYGQTTLASPYTLGQIYANKMLQTIIASLYTSPRGYILWEGKPLFEMCWFYMVLYGHYPNRLSPLPPLCQMGKRGKKCSKPSWQALTSPGIHW